MLREHRQPLRHLVHRSGARGSRSGQSAVSRCSATIAASTAAPDSARRRRVRDPGRTRPRLRRARADQQCAALLAASRPAGAGRQHRSRSHRSCQRPPAVLCAGPLRDRRRRVASAMQRADCVLVDGTCWSDDEIDRARRLEEARARHGPSPARAATAACSSCSSRCRRTTRKVLIHINNTNPILDEDGAERAHACAAPASRSRTTAWRSRCECCGRSDPTHRATHRGAATSSRRSCARAARRITSIIRSTACSTSGKATREQIRGWVANRYYYQISIPVKDAAILSNCPSRAMRREWIQRILDHDGSRRRRRRHRGVVAARARGRPFARGSWRTCATCCRACASRSMRT